MFESFGVGGIAAIVVYLLLCALAGAYCSMSKGRAGIEGFLLAVVLGPFGVIAAACLPEVPEPDPEPEPARPAEPAGSRRPGQWEGL